jgi:hypothetical protein
MKNKKEPAISDFQKIEREFAKYGADFNEVCQWYAATNNVIAGFNDILRALYMWVLHRSNIDTNSDVHTAAILDCSIYGDYGLFLWDSQGKLHRINRFFDIDQLNLK